MVNLWSQETEKEFFRTQLNSTEKEKLFYETDTGEFVAYWPKDYEGPKSGHVQGRNSHVGRFTEKWVAELLSEYAESKELLAVQGVVCEEIGLSEKSRADVALCRTNTVYQQPDNIAAIIEVKMSIVWNWKYWEYKNGKPLVELGDYSTHRGNPGLLRSDTMLKAIGKAAIIRASGYSSSTIPIIILGNTPISEKYCEKVDDVRRSGIIQGFWSVNPNPLDRNTTIKSTSGEGFIRMDTYEELTGHFDDLLSQESIFFSSMKSKGELGNIILTSSREETLERKAEKFLELIGR